MLQDVWQGWRDQRHFSPCTLRVPVNYDVTYQTIQGSADSFYHGTWKICHHGREFNLRWYSPLQNATTHLYLNLHIVLDKRKPYRSFLAAPVMISNVKSLAIVTSSICELLWRHPDLLFWHCIYGRFYHHNGVASQGVSAWRLIVMIVAGFIVVYYFVFVVE